MPFRATVVKVMLASPSDVAAERNIVRDVIFEWNAVHSDDRGLVLMPVAWESHSSPAMGERPQEIVSKQTLRNCDLLIGVFWMKFGTPTGKAESGTAEEINEHTASGKPALLYFSSALADPDLADSDQYRAVKAYKKEKMSSGLIEVYKDLSEFRQKLSRQLAQTIIREFGNISEKENAFALQNADAAIKIGDAAKELLLEAVKDRHGTIMRLQALGSSHVQTNGRDFVQSGDSRAIARWRGAVDELERLGFIEDRGGKGEVFFVTNDGFDAADRLALEA